MSRWQQLSKLLGLAAEDVAKLSPETLSTLERVATPEISTTLKGSERAKYLQALDEAYGNQDARAKAMGFGDKTWYHGTTVPIDEFQKEALGLSTGAQSAKKGFFFASDPSTASDYAELAREKGLIREGDKVTTRTMSETADLHNDLYDKVRELAFERDLKLGNIQRQIDRNVNTQSILERVKASGKDLDRIPDLEEKLRQGEAFIQKNRSEVDLLSGQIKNIDDTVGSTGQNVLPVRLKGSADTLHVKNYKGQGYRDTTYSDEMQKAIDDGKEGVLFRNTYDPADPNNKVKQNIAAVFEPQQIRSKFAAFDPRFKDSSKLLAGAGAMPVVNMDLGNQVKQFSQDVAEPIVERYQKLKDMVTTPLAKQLDLTKDKSVTEDMKTGLDLGLDPINLLGPASGGAAALFEMLGSKKKEDNGK